MNQDIKGPKESLNFAEDQYKKTTESFKEYNHQTSLKLSELQQKGNKLEDKIAELENRNLYLEAYFRGENIAVNLKTSKKNLIFTFFLKWSLGPNMPEVPRFSEFVIVTTRGKNKAQYHKGFNATKIASKILFWLPIERH